MSKSINVPKLRFKEFSGEWVNTKLGNLGNFQGGGTPATSEDKYWIGNIPWISSSDIIEGDIKNIKIHRFINDISIKESATKLIAKNSILFVSRVGIGKVAIANTDLCTSQDFTNLTLIKDDSYFIGYYFLSKNRLLEKYSQGTSIKGFTMNDLKTLKLNLPSKQEQEKIALFLASVDTKIEQLTKKEKLLQQYKKGVMQKIFNQEIRFKADDGSEFCDWEEKKLGDIFSGIKGQGLSKGDIVENGVNKCILYGELYTSYPEIIKEVISKTNSINGVKSLKGDLLIPCSTTTTRIDLADVTVLYEDNVLLGGDITILRFKKNGNSTFFGYYLTHYKKYDLAKYGQGSTIVHMYYSHFKTMIIKIPPSIQEQNKIANFLSSVDSKIEQVNKQLHSIKEFKKALLQQMFV